MKKLLIVGDSLSMSRHEEGVGYEQMYSSQLAISLPGRLIVNASERANSTIRIASSSYLGEYVYPMMPDVMIIQIGIVDCLPRLFTNFQRRVVSIASRISMTKGLANSYVGYMSKSRINITRKRPMSFVPITDFEKNLRHLITAVNSGKSQCKFIVIDIPCPGHGLNEKSYGADKFVCEYNDVLRSVFYERDSKFVELYAATLDNPSLLLRDGYHISEQGHRYLFNATRDILHEWEF